MLYNDLPYINTPNYCFAINPKAGCTTITYHIYKHYHDETHEFKESLNASHYINKLDHTLVPFKPVLLLVRHPMDRFLSAVNQVGISDIEECVESLIHHKKLCDPKYVHTHHISLRYDAHFRHQHERAFGETHLYKFPDHIEQVIKALGIEEKPLRLNVSKEPKKWLSPEQQNKILRYYQKDLELYNTIQSSNTIIDTRMA